MIAWTSAEPVPDLPLLGPLRHRLANAVAPLSVLAELAGEGAPLDDVTPAAVRCVAKVERICALIGALTGRQLLPRNTGEAVRLVVQGELPNDDFVRNVVGEWAVNAKRAGALLGTVQVRDAEGGLELLWDDDGKGFDTTEWLGGHAPQGEGSCGLGLAVIAAEARRRGGLLQIASENGARIRLFLPDTFIGA